MKTIKDGNVAVQVFAPYKIVSVTSGAAWTPAKTDIAFRVHEGVDYHMNSGATDVTLLAGSITGIRESTTYTFAANTDIEVM